MSTEIGSECACNVVVFYFQFPTYFHRQLYTLSGVFPELSFRKLNYSFKRSLFEKKSTIIDLRMSDNKQNFDIVLSLSVQKWAKNILMKPAGLTDAIYFVGRWC